MKIKQKIIMSVITLLLVSGNAFAKPHATPRNNGNGNSCNSNGLASLFTRCTKAPEIDAASGTSAIALLIGGVLLAGERVRSKRS
jgi:hypothetical protein